ncbi:histidine kinase [Echinicola pacifica]|uniref:Histidine kinase n=1 Tax=Echinicola pacifica TaxID=346377 RepID=A0A918USJ1_9BACT|nr:histidine kinase [Echinicola pacifica]GGZ31001.1 histidine kinase [Echinicola pacifica]
MLWILIGSGLLIFSPLSFNITLPEEFWVRQAVLFVVMVMIFYVNKEVLVPKYLFTTKTTIYLTIILSLCVLFMFFIEYFENLIHLKEAMHKAFHPDGGKPFKPKKDIFDVFTLLLLFLAAGISTSIATVQKWQADEVARKELDQQRIQTELNYLKAQINPHFFFNTLNNIYSLTSIDVERARTALHKLSRMMRYVLYETEKDQTLLSKEIGFVKDFISLMRLRISDKVQIDLQIDEEYEDRVIAPMILLPFVENCFKHGISSINQSYINIRIHVHEGQLVLETVNKIYPKNVNSPENNPHGIGLANTKRRLSLLYGNDYTLDINDSNPDQEYQVKLKIKI